MKPTLLLTAIVIALAAAPAEAQDKPANAEEVVRRVQGILEMPITIKFAADEMPLEKYLAVLEAALPEGKKISIRIDKDGLGKDFSKVAGTMILCHSLRNVSVGTVMRKGLNRVSGIEVDYAIRAGRVVITRPQLTGLRLVYDVRDVVRELPFLPPDVMNGLTQPPRDVKTDSPPKLIDLVATLVDFQPWETVEILNDSRLVVFASPTRQREVDGLLGALRRIADLFVVMNARLYEVDRAFYTKHVAPLFVRETGDQPQVISIDELLFRNISAKGKLLLESEEDRLRPQRQSGFLSRQSMFRFASGPDPTNGGTMLMETGLAGVSFEVQPLVSPDHLYLRLQITQKIADLLGIDKVKRLDIASGKEIEVESPNVRKTRVSGTVTIPDTGAILMPVAHPPSGKENADKVWLMVARPYIWIEEEMKGREEKVTPQSIWDSAFPKEEKKDKKEPERRLPSTDEVKEVLQAIITDVLTDLALKDLRNEYGTEADKTLTFEDSNELGWPKDFNPKTHGYKRVEIARDPFSNRVEGNRVLGIRLDKFELKELKALPAGPDGPIAVCVYNAGGSANGAIGGGCSIYYQAKRVGKRWTVEQLGLLGQ